jgi:hypothetical protein
MDPTLPTFEGAIILAQTAAGADYEAMLAATEARHRRYCEAHAIRFWSHVGLRRGHRPWHATFNRIDMLRDMLDAGWEGWFLYLDADTVIRQMDFDIRRYLGRRRRHAMIACTNGDADWAINAGVLFLNLGDESGRAIARRWAGRVDQVVTPELLEGSPEPWQPLADGRPFPDDQHLLQSILREEPALLAATLIERDPIFNLGSGRFIRQMIGEGGTPAERLAAIESIIAANPYA